MNRHSYYSVSSVRKMGREKRIFGDALFQERVKNAGRKAPQSARSFCLYAPVEGCTPQHTLSAYFHLFV